MAVSLSKKKSKLSKKAYESREFSLFSFIYRIPTTLFLLGLILIWSSWATIMSGKVVHVCVSSRKLNNLYCLSAGTQLPNFDIPIHSSNNVSSNLRFEQKGGENELPSVVLDHNLENLENLEKQVVSSDVVKNVVSDGDEELANAMKVVEEQLEVQRSWRSSSSRQSCDGRGIYVYELPSKFNKDLVDQCGNMTPWVNFCKYFSNGALGEPIHAIGDSWYKTHQYSLELIFHSRVLKHPCRVYNENDAKLFYVPFYGGLDILRWHFKNVSNTVKDSLGLELIKWLELQTPWILNSGKDHVFVLGKISWDFRRTNVEASWGTKFLELDQMKNPMKLLIERQPWQLNEIGIPHPTYFHPRTDADIIAWQNKIISSYRKNLVAFVGAPRPGAPENIRSILIDQCTSETGTKSCRFLNCKSGECDKPESIIDLFTESEFCLQPPGDSPTRKSVFDSLISGCIPVLFDPFTAYYQYPWHLPENREKYSVFIEKEEVRKMEVNVIEKLMKVSLDERNEMRRHIVYEIMPNLVYGDPNSSGLDIFQDAFSVTINNLLERITRLDSVV